MNKEYTTNDGVLPSLKLSDPCPITISISNKEVCLNVDKRDFVWDKKTGELTDTGCCIGDWDEEDDSKVEEKTFIDLIEDKYKDICVEGYTPFTYKIQKKGIQVYHNGEKYTVNKVVDINDPEDINFFENMLEDHNSGYRTGYEKAYNDVMKILANEFGFTINGGEEK